jgi:predicted nucleic acid-binding protein
LILIDANIFMYAAGAGHHHKMPSADFLGRVALGEIDAAVDAEVLQEILHHIGRSGVGRMAERFIHSRAGSCRS